MNKILANLVAPGPLISKADRFYNRKNKTIRNLKRMRNFALAALAGLASAQIYQTEQPVVLTDANDKKLGTITYGAGFIPKFDGDQSKLTMNVMAEMKLDTAKWPEDS